MKYTLNENCQIINSTTISGEYELCLDIEDIGDDEPILRALNVHDELVATLKSTLMYLEAYEALVRGDMVSHGGVTRKIELVKTVLSKTQAA